MLKALRNKSTQKKIYIVLAIVIIPPFVLWGTMTSNDEDKGAMPSSALGMINHRKVSIQDYLKSYTAVQHQMMLRFGDRLPQVASQLNLKGQAWDRLLLLSEAKKRGLKASDQEVVQWMVDQPLFFRKGKFDKEFYNLYVSRFLHTTERGFEEEIREALTLDKLRDKEVSTVRVSEEEIWAAYRQDNVGRDLVYGVIPWEADKDKMTVTDEDIAAVYAVVKGQLTDKKDGHTLTAEEAKAELKDLIGKQKATEGGIKKLTDLRATLKDNDLEKMLKDASIEARHAQKYVLGGNLPGIGASPEVDKNISQLKTGEISQPFMAPTGAVIVGLLKEWAADDAGFEKNRDKYRQAVLDKKSSDILDKLLQDLRKDLIINNETMNKLFEEEKTEEKTPN